MTKYIKWLLKVIKGFEYCLIGNQKTIQRNISNDEQFKHNRENIIIIQKRNKELETKVLFLETNGFLITDDIEQEIDDINEKIKSITILENIDWDDWENQESKVLKQIEDLQDWVIDLIKRIENYQNLINKNKEDSENNNKNLDILKIWNVRFCFIDKEISRVIYWKWYDKKEISKNLDLKKIWWNWSTQIALSWLYAIAKKYNENKDREFVFNFLSKKSEKDFQYFRDNCKIIHTRKTKDWVKITPKKRPYYNIVKDINKLSDVRGIVLEKTDLEDSDKEIRYLVKIIGKKYA